MWCKCNIAYCGICQNSVAKTLFVIERLVCRIYSKHRHKKSYYFVLNDNISGIIIYSQSKLNPLNCCQGNRAEDGEGRRDRVCVCVSQGSRRGVGGARVHFYFLIISAFSVSSWPTLHKLLIYRFQCRFGVISVIFAAGLCSKRVVSRRWRWFSSRLRSFSGGLEEQPGLRLFSVNCIRLIFISSLSIWGDCVSPFCILMTGFVFCCAMYMDKTSVLRGKNPFFCISYFISTY